ncbi:peptidogalycan biosysnthesis protein [Flavobacterium sp. SUN046]|uniref:peptidogalycan biosysnthesis protein n=1 Tax=Flavobacterium sp. SUN046 TaxID=3002440 RepID=UPI002DB84671|nr:peptidogalycan biosysnthesis protein [Flavobacterium sp. SUN046]MEC4049620.1 peptidogalycan biosysnthesis protein [Flavobacterium sp. SUN046]
MKTTYTFSIYSTTAELPERWDDLAIDNIFLSKRYLEVLEKSAPINMTCHFIGLFKDQTLEGIAISQFLDVNKLESFGDRDKCVKSTVRNFVFKNFCSHVLFIGNNMLTGQNALCISQEMDLKTAMLQLKAAAEDLKEIFKKRGSKVHITTFKDFDENEVAQIETDYQEDHYKFSIQPNMIFEIDDNWKTEQDYISALSKKYRDQYKRARKKIVAIDKRKMDLDDIIEHEDVIYDLYHHVAQNAPFNTFFIAKNHFRTFKEVLKDDFLFYGYFSEGKLIGFNTLIKNGEAMDTYFLGYDDSIQKEKMLYLNMLYDMIAYSINQGFKEVIFARTALEIKSSVGAKPVKMFGFIHHHNSAINKYMDKLFCYLEPETIWKERNPFKELT